MTAYNFQTYVDLINANDLAQLDDLTAVDPKLTGAIIEGLMAMDGLVEDRVKESNRMRSMRHKPYPHNNLSIFFTALGANGLLGTFEQAVTIAPDCYAQETLSGAIYAYPKRQDIEELKGIWDCVNPHLHPSEIGRLKSDVFLALKDNAYNHSFTRGAADVLMQLTKMLEACKHGTLSGFRAPSLEA